MVRQMNRGGGGVAKREQSCLWQGNGEGWGDQVPGPPETHQVAGGVQVVEVQRRRPPVLLAVQPLRGALVVVATPPPQTPPSGGTMITRS